MTESYLNQIENIRLYYTIENTAKNILQDTPDIPIYYILHYRNNLDNKNYARLTSKGRKELLHEVINDTSRTITNDKIFNLCYSNELQVLEYYNKIEYGKLEIAINNIFDLSDSLKNIKLINGFKSDEYLKSLLLFKELMESWFKDFSNYKDYFSVKSEILTHPLVNKHQNIKPLPTQRIFNDLFYKFYIDDNAEPEIVKKTLYDKEKFPKHYQNFRFARIEFRLWKVSDIKSKRQFSWWDKNNKARDLDPSEYEVL